MARSQKILVTAAPPTPNGGLHIGHLSGPFLGADVFSRYQRLLGNEVLYLSYADDFQEYVQRTALETGKTPETVADEFTQSIQETLQLGLMSPDHFYSPRKNDIHRQWMQSLFTDLEQGGVVEIREVPTFYCPQCKTYLYEGLARGHCRHCHEMSDATTCESCGIPQEPGEPTDAFCTQCHTLVDIRSEKRAFFQIEKMKERLHQYYGEREYWRPRLKALCRQLMQTVKEAPISRRFSLGVPVPLDGMEGQVLDTWYGGAAGYLSTACDWARSVGDPDLWKPYWESENARWVAFLGFDCGFSHAMLYPAMLMAQGRYQAPHTVITNEFYRLENKKISTSRNHAIWGSDILQAVQPDAVRFYLCQTAPEQEQTNFDLTRFLQLINDTLVDKWNAWLTQLLQQAARLNTIDLSLASNERIHPESLHLQKATLHAIKEVSRALSEENFSLQQAAREINGFVNQALRHYYRVCKPYTNYLSDLTTNLAAARTLSIIAAPLLPEFALSLRKALGEDGYTRQMLWKDLFQARVLIKPSVPEKPFFTKVTEGELNKLLPNHSTGEIHVG
ncbi:methionine--tRNA ligase [Salinithrix halophila]|uniref:Methionine--tRNA ligase n=1 Tax=Salinithrix halophila TaxID=1485204 RepID=A0ABV8JJG3_9BACL